VLGCIAAQRFTGGFLKTDQMGHYQSAKDQKVTIAEPGPERHKKTLYFFGQTRYLNHGWPRGGRMKDVWLPLSTPKQASPQVSGRTDRNYTALKIPKQTASQKLSTCKL
jgi:hypothetical protein